MRQHSTPRFRCSRAAVAVAAAVVGGSAQDLADLFALELDQSKNQYETVQRGQVRRPTGTAGAAGNR